MAGATLPSSTRWRVSAQYRSSNNACVTSRISRVVLFGVPAVRPPVFFPLAIYYYLLSTFQPRQRLPADLAGLRAHVIGGGMKQQMAHLSLLLYTGRGQPREIGADLGWTPGAGTAFSEVRTRHGKQKC